MHDARYMDPGHGQLELLFLNYLKNGAFSRIFNLFPGK